jgi:Zn-dependent peptidase ImmA (M78 family)
MRSVTDFIEELESKYGAVNFKKICEIEGILYAKAKLPENVHGFYLSHNSTRVIVIDERLSKDERRDTGMHELYHALKSPNVSSRHATKKEHHKANIFAALVRAPEVKLGDTVETLCERYGVSPLLAKLRIEHERKKILS